jgi:hypothetical protein
MGNLILGALHNLTFYEDRDSLNNKNFRVRFRKEPVINGQLMVPEFLIGIFPPDKHNVDLRSNLREYQSNLASVISIIFPYSNCEENLLFNFIETSSQLIRNYYRNLQIYNLDAKVFLAETTEALEGKDISKFILQKPWNDTSPLRTQNIISAESPLNLSRLLHTLEVTI